MDRIALRPLHQLDMLIYLELGVERPEPRCWCQSRCGGARWHRGTRTTMRSLPIRTSTWGAPSLAAQDVCSIDEAGTEDGSRATCPKRRIRRWRTAVPYVNCDFCYLLVGVKSSPISFARFCIDDAYEMPAVSPIPHFRCIQEPYKFSFIKMNWHDAGGIGYNRILVAMRRPRWRSAHICPYL